MATNPEVRSFFSRRDFMKTIAVATGALVGIAVSKRLINPDSIQIEAATIDKQIKSVDSLKFPGKQITMRLRDNFDFIQVEPVETDEPISAVIGATPIKDGWQVDVYQGVKPGIRTARIYKVPVQIKGLASSASGGREGKVGLRYDPDSGLYTEVRDVSTDRVHSTVAFKIEPDKAQLVAEGKGSTTLPNLKESTVYVFAAGEKPIFDPKADSWLSFSVTDNPDLRFPTVIFI